MKKIHTVMLFAFGALLCATPASAQFDKIKEYLSPAPTEPIKLIAHFKIKGAISETPVAMPPLFGGDPPTSMKSLLQRFEQARKDPNVLAVVIDIEQAALGIGQLEEIHTALRAFASVGKEVYVHADQLSLLTYAAASAASHVSITPTGELWLLGLYGEAPYLRGALDKLGIVPDFEQMGDFKSAAETLTRTGPSPQAAQMHKWLYDGLYDAIVELIAKGRGLSVDKVKRLIDDGPYSAEEAVKLGLIDSVEHHQKFVSDLRKRFGPSVKVVTQYGDKSSMDVPTDNMFAFFNFMMENLFTPGKKNSGGPSIAIVYVDGTIVTGEAEPSPFGGASGAHSTSIRKALDRAAADNSVKAVVLRVDSPGGSALASEIILDATHRVAKRKPLIVSMGNVAGSGGYYVTCASDTIFADKGTITASIGVIGGKLITTAAWEKLGVSWHPIKRGKNSGMMSTAARFSDREREKFVGYMEDTYATFKQHVVDARGTKLAKPIDELAGGRVFTGAQALEYGLIDKIGGLDDAIRYAANRANLGEYDIRVIPEPPTFFDMLMGSRQDDFANALAGTSLTMFDLPMFRTMLPMLAKVDPMRMKAMLHAMQRVELIHREGVILMTATDWVIR